MSDRHEEPGLDADQRRARDAVAGLSRPQADPAFRARLRERFVSGAIDEGASSRSTVRRAAPAPLPVWRKIAPAVVGVAVVLLLVVPWLRTPGMDLVAVHGANQVVFNGEVVSCADLSPIQAALLPGCRIQAPPGATVEVARSGEILMAVEGMEFTFPDRPIPFVRQELASSIEGDGTIRVATAPGFEGSRYRLRVGDAEFLVRDSVFALSRSGNEIGVTVLEGELEAVMPGGRSEVLGPRSGARILGGEFAPMEFDPYEAEGLQSLRERAVLI